MASYVIRGNEQFKGLANLLMAAAGIPDDKRRSVKSITCRCTYEEAVSFTIEKYGEEEDIRKAVEG